jgi:N-acetylgalactosamine-N,N'-diacetylbacillosaminyl-diphospho-undecaprenol 4-alpha-N-acetylgalactosaminyltransferase
MSKGKVCLVIVNLGKGGAETVLADLAKQLAKNYEVHICVFDNLIKQDIDPRCTIHTLLTFKTPSILRLLLIPFISFKLFRYLKTHQITNIISFLERGNYVSCLLTFFTNRFNHIVTVNTALSQWYKKGTLAGIVGRMLVKLFYPKADSVVCCSKYIAAEMKNLFGVDSQKITTIYNGIDLEKIEKHQEGNTVIDSDVYTFIHVGSFYEGKNHLLLLDGFSQFLATSRKANLVLIGRGYMRDKILARISEDNLLCSHVIAPENVENQYAYMYQADCFVLSSDFEGLPTVIMEAFACGLNVISTDCISGPRELLTEPLEIQKKLSGEIEIGKYGILVPVNASELLCSAMIRMVDDEVMAASQRNSISLQKTKFNIKLMSNSYDRLLKF